MPPAIAIGASLFGTWAVGAIGLTGILGTIVGGLISMGVSSIANSLFGDKSSGGGSTGVKDSGILVTTDGNINPIPVVYGSRRVAGSRVYIAATEDNKYLELVYVIAEGPIQSIDAIYFNGNLVIKGPLNVNGKLPTALDKVGGDEINYKDSVSGEFRLGNNDQAAMSDLIKNTKDLDGGKWTSAHRLAGVACVYLRLKYNRDVFTGIPEVQFDVSGRKIANVTNLAAADRFSTNPADVMYDYLTAARPYSKRVSKDLIDIQSFKDAAVYCDQIEAGIGNRKRYEINGHIDTGDSMFNNVKRILSNFNAFLVVSNGIYKLVINKPETPTGFVFDESNIIGKIDYALGSKEMRLNTIKSNFFNPDLEWAADIYQLKNDTYYQYDGNVELLREIDFAMLGDRRRAGYISQIILNQSRYSGTVAFQAAPEAFNVEVGQVVELRHEFLFGDTSMDPKYYRVMGLKLNTDTTVMVTLQEYSANVYAVTPVEARPRVVRPRLPSANYVAPPSGPLTVANSSVIQKDGSVTSSLLITWTAATTPDVRNYEVTIFDSVTTKSVILTTVNTQITYEGIVDGRNYTVEVRTVNTNGSRSGALD
jgi:hypothetical protein